MSGLTVPLHTCSQDTHVPSAYSHITLNIVYIETYTFVAHNVVKVYRKISENSEILI